MGLVIPLSPSLSLSLSHTHSHPLLSASYCSRAVEGSGSDDLKLLDEAAKVSSRVHSILAHSQDIMLPRVRNILVDSLDIMLPGCGVALLYDPVTPVC